MKLKNLLLAILIVFSYVNGFSQKENVKKEVKKAVKKAVKELKNDKSDYIDAIKIYEKVIENGRSEDEDLFIKIARSYYFNSNYSKSAEWFGKYYKIDSVKPLPIYNYWYGQSLKALNKHRKADSLLGPYYESKGEQYVNNTHNLKTTPNNSDRYELLPFKHNTEFSDYSAYLHGDRLYFITNISNGNKLGWLNNNTSDIFFIDNSNVEIQKPYGDLNSKFNEGSLVITKDGKTMYFTRNALITNKYIKTKKGELKTYILNIYKAELIDSEWKNVTPLSINNPNYSVGHPTLSADEKTLYFSSDMPGGKGLTDLYSVSINEEDGSLGKPKNLETLNTIGKEMFPFVDRETNILYFSSDRPSSLGGLDVFLSKLESDGTYKHAFNIGKPINSSFDDFSYMINNSKKGYFSSNKREETDAENQLDEIYSFIENMPFSFPDILVIKGTIKDIFTKEFMPDVTLTLYDINGNSIETKKSDNTGAFNFDNFNGANVAFVRAEKEDYLTEEIAIDSNNVKDYIKNLDITLSKIKIANIAGEDMASILNPIYFDYGKSAIREDAEVELEKIVQVLHAYSDVNILIGSHTDSRSPKSFNQKLSQRRAESTYNYLVSRGINAARLSYKGYGETELVNRCSDGVECSEEEHQLNRRSSFVIQK